MVQVMVIAWLNGEPIRFVTTAHFAVTMDDNGYYHVHRAYTEDFSSGDVN